MQASAEFHRVALIGTGTIGAAWAAYLLSRRLEVVATDPAPEAEARLAERIRGMWPPLERLGLAEGADPARLVFAGTVEEAVEGTRRTTSNIEPRLYRFPHRLVVDPLFLAGFAHLARPLCFRSGEWPRVYLFCS